MAPLLAVAGATFVSLQKGPRSRDVERHPEWRIIDFDAELSDFDDTAAAICHLDLVICVDTAVAHLAGALGVPVWMLLPQPADYRWMLERRDSPWYPSLRLFRQTRRTQWEDVIASMRDVLVSSFSIR